MVVQALHRLFLGHQLFTLVVVAVVDIQQEAGLVALEEQAEAVMAP
jgi:hypothetical protein